MNLRDLKLPKFALLKEGIVFVLLFVLIVFIYNLFFNAPVKRMIKELKADMASLEGNRANYLAISAALGKETERLQELTKSYEEMESSLLLSKEQILPAKEIPNILKELSSPRPGLTIVSVHTSPVEDKGEYLRLPLVLSLRGDFRSFGAYIDSLENSRRLVGVENINMVKDEKGGLTIRLELSAYLMKEGAV